MDADQIISERVAEAGDVIATEPCFELTEAALAYLAEHGGDRG